MRNAKWLFFLLILGFAQTAPALQPAEKPAQPKPGTLLAGPWRVGAEVERARIRWEVMGERPSKLVVLRDADRSEEVPGRLLKEGEIAADFPGRVYEARVEGLKPCETIRYRIEPWEEGFPRTMRQPPSPGQTCDRVFRFAAIGDTRHFHDRHRRIIEAMIPRKPELLVNTGDIVNAPLPYRDWWAFFRVLRDVADRIPVFVAPGNHEYLRLVGLGSAFLRRYFGVDDLLVPGHYSFDWGPARFIVIDPYAGVSMSGRGLKWLKRELKSVPKGRHTFVVIHNPLISFGKHSISSSLRAIRPLMHEHNVRAVISGHCHLYEHFKIRNTHYLTLGGGGASFHEPNVNVRKDQIKYRIKTGKFHHYALIEITPKGIRYTVYNTDNNTIADTWLQ